MREILYLLALVFFAASAFTTGYFVCLLRDQRRTLLSEPVGMSCVQYTATAWNKPQSVSATSSNTIVVPLTGDLLVSEETKVTDFRFWSDLIEMSIRRAPLDVTGVLMHNKSVRVKIVSDKHERH